MSHVIPINPAPTEELPLYLKRAAERELNYGPAVFTVANAEELRKFPRDRCYEGLCTYIQYLKDPRDFGGGMFVWKSSLVNDDNNGVFIEPDGPPDIGRWVRVEALGRSSYVDIRWFGAIPDIKGIDNSYDMNRSIQSLPLYATADMTINGGSMRRGKCFIPAGIWYVSDTVVASSGVWVAGEGSIATTIHLNDNCPLFETVHTLSIAGLTQQFQNTLGGKAVQFSQHTTRVTFADSHGFTVGTQVMGLIEGLAGESAINNTNGRWWRFHVLNSTQMEFLSYEVVPTGFAGATIEFEKFILDFQWSQGMIADNDLFGTQCSNLTVHGEAFVNNQNSSSSGIYIWGSERSSCRDVTVWSVGIRGIDLGVPGDNVGVGPCRRGPGLYTTQGYLVNHGNLQSGHCNKDAIYYISDAGNPPIPRPAFLFTNVHWATYQSLVGEDSVVEMHFRNCTQVSIGDMTFNAAGVDEIVNGYPKTQVHISGWSHTFDFKGKYLVLGKYKNLVRDITGHAVAAGVAGNFDNFRESSARTGNAGNYPVHTILLGPYADDGEAAKFGVPVGATYKTVDGVITWRETPGPFEHDAQAAANGVPPGGAYLGLDWTTRTRATDFSHPVTFTAIQEMLSADLELLPETLDYLDVSGIDFAHAARLDIFIRGLKDLDAWDDLSMWLLDTRYQSAGASVCGSGGQVVHGLKENGLGSIQESESEYYFTRGTARVWTPEVLMPASVPAAPESVTSTSHLMSLMMVARLPQLGSNYGGIFGGRINTASINSQEEWGALGVGLSGTGGNAGVRSHVFSNATQAAQTAQLTPTPRKALMMTLTGERSGNCSINGGALVAATAKTHDYSSLIKDSQSSIWGPGDSILQSNAPGAASFVGFWRGDQSAKAPAIYQLYKHTIGHHLGLP
jgi:hypothetical protein